MIKHFCDRCGKEIPPSNTRTYVQCRDQSGDVSFDFKSEYELCLECKDKLEVFLEGSSDTGSCEFCKDLDYLLGIVCYIPNDNGDAEFVPVNYCPKCGRKVDDE